MQHNNGLNNQLPIIAEDQEPAINDSENGNINNNKNAKNFSNNSNNITGNDDNQNKDIYNNNDTNIVDDILQSIPISSDNQQELSDSSNLQGSFFPSIAEYIRSYHFPLEGDRPGVIYEANINDLSRNILDNLHLRDRNSNSNSNNMNTSNRNSLNLEHQPDNVIDFKNINDKNQENNINTTDLKTQLDLATLTPFELGYELALAPDRGPPSLSSMSLDQLSLDDKAFLEQYEYELAVLTRREVDNNSVINDNNSDTDGNSDKNDNNNGNENNKNNNSDSNINN
ncbi:uncharacterized protein ASCRUDRAFT_72946 [Ascoidea rubescens DSM 1968]|uniref:Uncharacterized protein n=1 Tax=Ascoidea rubescens DSM 1968 TaxID=1344418 RepID=A0A1D2V954_9ASCO|nr:hypothetical protein ASCRUDRAFT_72946 [Ascoidea rubescens DSM 1968]ODV58089.1 hypothetical protein ASCRUDRAFT_72946 [Ascoidea rubescens DSM 1968]